MDKDHGMEFPNALGTYISKGVRGVKDDCQRFRLEMQMLKEKTEDIRKREVEVEGMANRVKRRLMEELDVVAHRNLDTLMQPSQIAQPSTREREVAILRLPLSIILQYVGEIHVPMANNFLGRNLWGEKAHIRS
jgi:hypothetical protein